MAGQERTSVEWENLDDVQKAMAEALQSVAASSVTAVRSITRDAERRARELVPVDTGRLRRSISSDVEGKELVVGTVSADTEYAAYVEYGTSRMHAQPYLRPAMLEAQRAWAANAGKDVHW
jgi:HK97 gp10 family phage protein